MTCLACEGTGWICEVHQISLGKARTHAPAAALARRPEGIFVSDFEQGEIGPDLFRHACLLGLEGLVSNITVAFCEVF